MANVSTPHPDYADNVDVWQQMRDVITGGRAIKAQGEKYLPKLSKQTPEDYEAYKMRADYYDGTSRASDAMMGFLFRKPPKVNIPEGNTDLEEFQRDATLTGKSFYDLMKETSRKLIELGRCGIWIDWSDEEARPFALLYEPQDIINWEYGRRGGRMVLTHLVLHELSPDFIDLGGMSPPDRYSQAVYDQWREFDLRGDGDGNSFVEIRVWRKKKALPQQKSTPTSLGGRIANAFGTGPAPQSGDDQYVVVDTLYPQRGGVSINLIPFTFVGTDGPYPEVSKPPLLGMSDMNLSHYRTSADLENARHYVGVPTPWAAGFTEEGGKPQSLTLGSSRVWLTSNTGASCGFLQVQGNFESLTGGLDSKKQEMAELGVQMVASQEADQSPEAYATVALRQTSQTSNLTGLSRSLSQCLTDVITTAAWWDSRVDVPQDLQDNINVQMNLDFMGQQMSAQEATGYMQMFIQGAISYATLFKLLQEGEIIEDGLTMEEEMDRIEEGKTHLLAAPDFSKDMARMKLQQQNQPKTPPVKKKGAPEPKQSSV